MVPKTTALELSETTGYFSTSDSTDKGNNRVREGSPDTFAFIGAREL